MLGSRRRFASVAPSDPGRASDAADGGARAAVAVDEEEQQLTWDRIKAGMSHDGCASLVKWVDVIQKLRLVPEYCAENLNAGSLARILPPDAPFGDCVQLHAFLVSVTENKRIGLTAAARKTESRQIAAMLHDDSKDGMDVNRRLLIMFEMELVVSSFFAAIAAEALLNGPSNEGCAAAAPLSANAVTESGNATDTNATVQIERRWTSDLEDCSPLERTEIICWIASFIFSAIAVIAIMAPVVPWLVAKPFKRSLSERLRTHGNAWNFAMWPYNNGLTGISFALVAMLFRILNQFDPFFGWVALGVVLLNGIMFMAFQCKGASFLYDTSCYEGVLGLSMTQGFAMLHRQIPDEDVIAETHSSGLAEPGLGSSNMGSLGPETTEVVLLSESPF